jgi:hypothetical protein
MPHYGQRFAPFGVGRKMWISAGIVSAKFLSPGCKLVLLALCSYAGKQDRCWPSLQSLARDTGLSERQVRRHLATIEKHNLGRRDERIATSNMFIFLYHRLWPLDPRAPGVKYDRVLADIRDREGADRYDRGKVQSEQKRAVVFKPAAVKNVSAVKPPAAVLPNGAAGFPLTFKAISEVFATTEAYADRVGRACRASRPSITDREVADYVALVLLKFKPRSAGFLLEKIPQVIRWQDSNT